jgi:DNA-directed RNA polymerase specialized sigma subunit
MIPTNNISIFLRHNDSELRFMIIHICESLDYPESVEDLVQGIYTKFLTSDILQSYNRHFCRGRSMSSQMSTYLYPIIRNHILSLLKSQDYRFMKNQVSDYDPDLADDMHEIDQTLKNNEIAEEYKSTLHYNNDSDQIDGTAFELRDFEARFEKSEENKKFDLKKRKNKNEKIPECTLLEIFRYLYKGYSNKQIARIYGVTDMSITHMKHKLAEAMVKYGFGKLGQLYDSIEVPEMSVEDRD